MRPRRERLGYGTLHRLVVSVEWMLQCGRGANASDTSRWHGRTVLTGQCFNEAGARTPRIPFSYPIFGVYSTGFNEAEARTPRIPSITVTPLAARWSFNEAAAMLAAGRISARARVAHVFTMSNNVPRQPPITADRSSVSCAGWYLSAALSCRAL